MRDPYGYRPYRGSRVRRRGIFINLLLAIAILAAAVWVLCLLLPLEEGGLRFPGQEAPLASDSAGSEGAGDAAPDPAGGEGAGDAAPDPAGGEGAGDAAPDPAGGDGAGDAALDPAGGEGAGDAALDPAGGEGAGDAAPDPAEGSTDPEGQPPADGNGDAPPAETDTPPDEGASGPDVSGLAGTLSPLKNIGKASPLFPPWPDPPKNDRMVLLSAEHFVSQTDTLLTLFRNGSVSGAAVTLKDERGILYYPSQIADVQGRREILQPVGGLSEAIAKAKEAGMPLTAVLYTHCDDRFARRDESIALQNINHIGWRDHNSRIFLDPANERATAYLIAVAQETAALGFEELVLRGVGYPSAGWLQRISYASDRYGTVTGVVTAIRDAVPDAQVSVWLDSPGIAENGDTGQSVSALYAAAARVFAALPTEANGGAAALQAALSANAGDTAKLVTAVTSTADAEGLPAVLLDVPLNALVPAS